MSLAEERIIVVTGMGVAAAAGETPEDLWRAVSRGISPAVSFADSSMPESPTIPACVVPGPTEDALRLRRSHKMDRCTQLALEAALRAHADAELHTRPAEPSAVGIMAGTSR